MLNRRFLIDLMSKLRDEIAYEATKGLTGTELKQCTTKIKDVS